MPVLRLNLSATSGEGFAGGPSGTGDLETRIRIRRQFRFLPDPITVKVEGDEVFDKLVIDLCPMRSPND